MTLLIAPFLLPVRMSDEHYLVAADSELIAKLDSATTQEKAHIVAALNAMPLLVKMKDLFADSLSAWEDEEDSVQREHSELIADMNKVWDELGALK